MSNNSKVGVINNNSKTPVVPSIKKVQTTTDKE